MLLVLFTFLFPLVYAEFKNITYYNGWRHYLFIYPSLVALIALGYDYVFSYVKPKFIGYILAVVMLGLAVVYVNLAIYNYMFGLVDSLSKWMQSPTLPVSMKNK